MNKTEFQRPSTLQSPGGPEGSSFIRGKAGIGIPGGSGMRSLMNPKYERKIPYLLVLKTRNLSTARFRGPGTVSIMPEPYVQGPLITDALMTSTSCGKKSGG